MFCSFISLISFTSSSAKGRISVGAFSRLRYRKKKCNELHDGYSGCARIKPQDEHWEERTDNVIVATRMAYMSQRLLTGSWLEDAIWDGKACLTNHLRLTRARTWITLDSRPTQGKTKFNSLSGHHPERAIEKWDLLNMKSNLQTSKHTSHILDQNSRRDTIKDSAEMFVYVYTPDAVERRIYHLLSQLSRK